MHTRPERRPKTSVPRRQKRTGGTPQAEQPLSPARAFVVQFREGAAGRRFTGRVEHMTTGRAARFASPEELQAFFLRVLNALRANRSAKEESNLPASTEGTP